MRKKVIRFMAATAVTVLLAAVSVFATGCLVQSIDGIYDGRNGYRNRVYGKIVRFERLGRFVYLLRIRLIQTCVFDVWRNGEFDLRFPFHSSVQYFGR